LTPYQIFFQRDLRVSIEPLLSEVEKYLKPSTSFVTPLPATEFQGPFFAGTTIATITPSVIMMEPLSSLKKIKDS